MRKPFQLRKIVMVLIACVVGAYALKAYLDRDPSVEGKRLSEWIWQMRGAEPGPANEQARAAIRSLGTNSVPLLLDWLREDYHPSMTARLDGVRHRVFFWLVGHKLIPNREIRSLRDFNPSRRAMAMWALPELDAAAKRAAIPTLIEMLGEKKEQSNEPSDTAGVAYVVLAQMSPESIDPLVTAFSSPDFQVRMLAAGALAEIGPSAKKAIPILANALNDKDPNVRAGTAVAIGKLGGDPPSFVFVLIRSLPELEPESLAYFLEELLRYKEHAEAAVPILEEILKRTDHSTNQTAALNRDQLLRALQQIAPASVHSLAE